MPTSATPPRSTPRREHGVTLVETCAVVAILAILATTAAPAMRDLIDGRRLEGTATQLASDLQFVRTEAVARNQALRLSLHPTALGSCYVIHSGAAGQCACDIPGPAQCSGGAREIRTVAIGSDERVALLGNVASIVFDPLHGTASPTGTLRVVGHRGRAIHHVVNVMGRVRSCSPQSAVAGYRAC